MTDHEIATRRNELMGLFGAFDAARFAELVTPDIIWAPPHGTPQFGATALVNWLAPFFAQYAYELILKPATLSVGTDGAFEHGQVTSRITPKGPDGSAVENVSRYLIIWRPSGGGWRLGLFCDTAALEFVS